MTHVPTAIPWVAQQHVDDAAFLAVLRLKLAHAKYVGLRELSRFDERLAANLAGIEAADETGWRFCMAGLGDVSVGTLFTATGDALQRRNGERLAFCLRIAETERRSRTGVFAAFGWSSHRLLHGTVVELLTARESFNRAIAVAACAMHGVEPAPNLSRWIADPDPLVRARAAKAAAMLGKAEAITDLGGLRPDATEELKFWTAWSMVLLGERDRALEVLSGAEFERDEHRRRARALSVQAMSRTGVQKYLRDLGTLVTRTEAISLVGLTGDPTYIPWLVEQMAEAEKARCAADAMTLITGMQLDAQHLAADAPSTFESGPNDNPDDPNVDMDPDDGLPWPDVKKVEAWWHANEHRFQKGTRYFMGQPVTKEHCIHVLKTGYQRQRILAAQYLCLLEPGTPLFNTSAPAWRQQRLLAAM